MVALLAMVLLDLFMVVVRGGGDSVDPRDGTNRRAGHRFSYGHWGEGRYGFIGINGLRSIP